MRRDDLAKVPSELSDLASRQALAISKKRLSDTPASAAAWAGGRPPSPSCHRASVFRRCMAFALRSVDIAAHMAASIAGTGSPRNGASTAWFASSPDPPATPSGTPASS
jgi:hypothetical protein